MTERALRDKARRMGYRLRKDRRSGLYTVIDASRNVSMYYFTECTLADVEHFLDNAEAV